MTDLKLLRALLRDRVIARGCDWLRQVLAAANVTRISDLSHAQLTAILEERETTPAVDA
jgi:hypothetical protein